MSNDARVLLIGGTSHVGKSTLAQCLAARLGWQCIATDSLARHPGRPWRAPPAQVPVQVAEHYLSLDVDALVADVRRHYLSMWPGIAALIAARVEDSSNDSLILEGSALLPESIAALHLSGVVGVWLTAREDFLQRRIEQSSGLATAPVEQRAMIDKFVARTLAFNRLVLDDVSRLGLLSVDVSKVRSVDALADRCLALVGLLADFSGCEFVS